MSKPLLLSSGSGKVQEFVGTATGQLPTWSQSTQEWVLGTNGGSGGGGAIFYLNSAAAADTPTTNVPGGTGGATAYFTPAQLSQTFNATASTRLSPPTGDLPHNGSWAIVQGLLSDDALGLTALPPGLWDFNIWAKASTGAGPSQVEFRVRVGVYADSTNTLTYLFNSDSIFVYDPTVTAQYPASVVIGSNTIAATDRLYVEVNARSSVNNRTATFYFGGNNPSHVHTTIQVPVNLATDVTGTLPVANGGTGVTTLTGYVKGAGTAAMTASATIPVADVTGAAPLASPTFTGTPLSTTAAADNSSTQIATTAYVVGQASSSSPVMDGSATTGTSLKYARADHVHPSDTSRAPLASPTFSGTVTLPLTTAGYAKTTSAGVISSSATVAVADLSGAVSVANGGTNNASLSVVQGTVYYGDGSKLVGLAPGTSGQFLQTQGASANPQWAAASGGTTAYDISGEFVGTPVTSAVIMRFVAARAFTFGGTAQFACVTGPTSTATFTVNVNGVSKGTVTISTSATSGSGTITSTSIVAGDLITVVATTPAAVVSPYWTLLGTV